MKILLIFISLLLSIHTFSQTLSQKSLVNTTDGVDIYITKEDCIDKHQGTAKQLLIIELVNNNSYPVNISIKKEMWFDNNCQTCNSDSKEYMINETITEKSSLTGGCKLENSKLNIFVKMLNIEHVRKLTNYELKNIKVEKVN